MRGQQRHRISRGAGRCLYLSIRRIRFRIQLVNQPQRAQPHLVHDRVYLDRVHEVVQEVDQRGDADECQRE
ncbi:Uncharacterised protein [Mycobacterium tuberculosis]|uniref:Uncharacterized protein n=1 Tax=Mycobacterium tuberculosis TaxID=1773 RepID=A0A0U0QWH0_MYCTX|nr:Uncharacterised protein [Mycobacterium tuberculosis]COV69586.1 Uncharacterised protein [Mycobacterium tuberculosis]